MAKRKTDVDIIDEDEGLVVDLTPKATRQFKGTDENPTDAETGEDLFEDITPALRNAKPDPAPELDDDEDDEGEEEELAASKDEEIEPEEEDEPKLRRGGKFQRRIDRERRLNQEKDEEIQELRDRLDALDNRSRIGDLESKFNGEKSKLEGEIADLEKQLTQAIEDGESAKQGQLTRELIKKTADLQTKQIVFDREKDTSKVAAAPEVAVARKAQQWIRKHPRFKTDTEFRDDVKLLDKQVAAAGFDPSTPEFYEELDRRLKKHYPKEFATARREEAEEEAPRRRPPTQNLRSDSRPAPKRSADGFERRGNTVRLTARQVSNMRTFNLDPTNPNHVREYVSQNRSK